MVEWSLRTKLLSISKDSVLQILFPPAPLSQRVVASLGQLATRLDFLADFHQAGFQLGHDRRTLCLAQRQASLRPSRSSRASSFSTAYNSPNRARISGAIRSSGDDFQSGIVSQTAADMSSTTDIHNAFTQLGVDLVAIALEFAAKTFQNSPWAILPAGPI